MPNAYVKDPSAVLDWKFDWSSWVASGEVISISQVIVPTGLTLDTTSNDTTTVTAWISGGTTGETYTVTNRITTDQGRVDDRSIVIRVAER